MSIDYTKYKFISDGTWFDKGTEARYICAALESKGKLICALFEGQVEGVYGDEESCALDEFWIYDENGTLISKPEEE